MQCGQRELLRVVRDQIEERGVAIIASNKEPTIWRKTSFLREKQLKYTDVEEMRVTTNDRHTAEQIKSDLHCPDRETCCAVGSRTS